jgi:nucleoside phosphorylase
MKYLDITLDDLVASHVPPRLLLVTVTASETTAVLQQLQPMPERDCLLRIFHKQYTYNVGVFGAYAVAHLQCAMGSMRRDAATVAIHDGIDFWNARAVIMIGIAFGRDQERQRLGDVIVSDSVALYEPAKIRSRRTEQRGPILQSGKVLLNRFRNHEDWTTQFADGHDCRVIVGQLLSGEKLVDDYRYKASLFKAYPHAIGGEMEGAGLSTASDSRGVEWLIVKSICDWADGTKHNSFQLEAARNAAAFCKYVLSSPRALASLDIPETDVWKEVLIPPQTEQFRSDDPPGGLFPIADLVRTSFALIERIQTRSIVTGVPTGFMELDELLGGLQPAQLTVVAGRASAAKTPFLLSLALNAIHAGRSVVFFSLDISKEALFIQLLTAAARIDATRFRLGFFSTDDYGKLVHAFGVLEPASMYVCDEGQPDARELGQRLLLANLARPVDLILIDTLRHLRGSASESIRALKQLAVDRNVPVVVTADLMGGPHGRPSLDQLNEPAIELSSDVIMLLHHVDSGDAIPYLAECIVAKHKQGPKGTIELVYLDNIGRFENIARG